MTEESLFDAVLAKPSEERRAYLELACAGDTALLQRLQRLVAAHERASGILDQEKAAGAAGIATDYLQPVNPKGTQLKSQIESQIELRPNSVRPKIC